MKKLVLILSALFFSLTLASAQTDRPIGVNLGDISPWASQLMFVDAMKQSSSWFAQHTDFSDFDVDSVNGVAVQVPLRPDGYPTHAPFEINGDTLQPHVILLSNQPAPWYYPSGDYTLEFSGTGVVGVSWDVQQAPWDFVVADVSDSVYIVPVAATGLGIDIVILYSDSLDPVHDIRFVMPGYEQTYTTDPFHPNFLSLLNPFGTLRFMKPLAVEGNSIEDWADRTPLNYYHYGSEGDGEHRDFLPYELMIRLCNEQQKDCWLNVPTAATNDYIDSLATLFHTELDSNLTLYLEWSNEPWNPGYAYHQSVVNTRGLQLGFDTLTWEAGLKYSVFRAVETFERFESVYGAGNDQLYTVLTSMAWDYPGRITLNALNSTQTNPNGTLPDAISVAPYLGSEIIINLTANGDACVLDSTDLLDSLEANIGATMQDLAAPFAFWADSMGIDLVSYEGGQYLSDGYGFIPVDPCIEDDMHAANRDARMGDIYCEYYDYWYDTLDADLHVTFMLCEAMGDFGAFGLVESIFQNTGDAVKYTAHTANGSCGFGTTTAKNDAFDSTPEPQDAWKLYPNPASDRFFLSGLDRTAPVEIEIYDVQGLRVHLVTSGCDDVEQDGVSVRRYPAGIYFVKVRQGMQVRTFKMIHR